MNQACLSNRCVGRSVETRPGLGRGQGGSPRHSKHGCGTQGDRWGIVWRSGHLAGRQLAIGPPSNSRLAYVVCLSPVNSPAHPLQLLDPAIPPPTHRLPSEPASRLFIAFVISEIGRPRVVLTDDSLEGGLSTETELQQKVVSNQCFMCFNQLDHVRKPMRNTQRKGIAHCAFPLLQAMRGFPLQALRVNHPRPWVPHPQWPFPPRHAVEAQFVCSIRLPSPPGRSDRLGEAD